MTFFRTKSNNLAIFVMIDKKGGDNADRIHRYFRLLIYLYAAMSEENLFFQPDCGIILIVFQDFLTKWFAVGTSKKNQE